MHDIFKSDIIRKTMSDFVKMSATGSTPLGQYIIPIKRTFTHKELEKNIEIA